MACTVVPTLVCDRLAEFRKLANSKGTLQQDVPAPVLEVNKDKVGKLGLLHHREPPAVAPSKAEPAANDFMKTFFEAVGEAHIVLKEGHACVREMEGLFGQYLQATMQDEQSQAMSRLDELASTTRTCIASSKEALDALYAQADGESKAQPSPAQQQIRSNMQRAVASKHQQLLMDFQQVQKDIKGALEQRQFAEMQLICPGATGEQIHDMIDAGQTSSQMMVRRMAGAHGAIVEEVERICEKHQEILRLEQSISDLAQMTQEIALLVDAQGELLDNIEANVHNTSVYTGKGAKELDKALTIQKNTRKWQCFLSCFCMSLLLLIMAPVVLR